MRRRSLLSNVLVMAGLAALLVACGGDECPECPECPPVVTGAVFGTVRVAPVSDALPGVTVTAEPGGLSARSDSSGLYRLNGLPAGAYRLHCAKDGYAPDSSVVVLAAGANQLMDFRLNSLTDSLGHVVSVTTAGGAYGVAVRDRIAYVAGAAGLQVFDVADDAQPLLLGLAAFAGAEAGAVILKDDVAYVAHRTSRIEVVDLSALAAPAVVRSVRVGGLAYDLELDGNVLLAATSDSLVVLDVSAPQAPQILARLATNRTAYGGSNRGLALDAGRKLAFVFSVDTMTEVFDYSIPVATVRIGVYGSTGSPFDGFVDPATSRAYLATATGLEFLSYAQPAGPQLLGFWHGGADWRDVLVVRSLAIVASPQYGLWVLDITDRDHVRLLQLLQGELFGHPRNIAREGDRIYVAGDARLSVFEFAAAPSVEVVAGAGHRQP